MGGPLATGGGHEHGVRSTFRLHRAISHWAAEASAPWSGEGSDGAAAAATTRRHAAAAAADRAEVIRAGIERDCVWAAAGLAREAARHVELRRAIDAARDETERRVSAARADEAKHCQDELRALSVELANAEDELATRVRQLKFVEADRDALLATRDELDHQIAMAGRKEEAEGERPEGARLLQRMRGEVSPMGCAVGGAAWGL